MFCTKCGAQLPDGSRFCSKCGADLTSALQKAGKETPSPQEEVTSAPVAQEEASSETKSSVTSDSASQRAATVRVAIITIVGLILVGGIGIGAYFYLQSSTGTPIDEEHFPDKSFCSFVATQLDTDGNGILSAKEVAQTTTVDLSTQSDIQDIAGIAVFTDLQTFVLGPNTVETVDLSQNTGLTEIDTQAGTTTNIHVPTGFVDNGGSLLTGNTNVYEGPGDAVVLSEKTADSATEGVLSDVQFHNETLCVGSSLASNTGTTKAMKDVTPFFKDSDLFLYADGKVFWLERTQATSFYSTVIYMANEDGSDQKEAAQYAHEVMPITYTNGWLIYSSSSGPHAKNVNTGEEKDLSGFVANMTQPILDAIVGVHDGNVVMQNKPSGASSPEYLLVSTQTWEVVSIMQPPTQSGTLSSIATEKGVLTAGSDGSLSQVGYDGKVLWSKSFDFLKADNRKFSLTDAYCNNKELFILPAEYKASVQIINLETGDLNTLDLKLDPPKTASVEYADDSVIYLTGEGSHLKVDRATGKLVE